MLPTLKTALALLLIGLCPRPVLAQQKPLPDSPLSDSPPPKWLKKFRHAPFPELINPGKTDSLVLCKVVTTARTALDPLQEVVVTRTLVGPDLVGRKWFNNPFFYTYPGNLPSPKSTPGPFFKVGQKFLCVLSASDYAYGTLPPKSNFYLKQGYGLDGLDLLDGSPNAQLAWQQAAAVQKAYHAPPDRLEGLIKEFTQSNNFLTATWATRILAYWISPDTRKAYFEEPSGFQLRDPQAAKDLLSRLAGQLDRPVLQQIALDSVLFRVSGENWNASPQRFAMLKQLFSRPLSAEDGDYNYGIYGIYGILYGLTHDRAIPTTQKLDLLATYVQNPTVPLHSQEDFVDPLGLREKEALQYWAETLPPHLQCTYAPTIINALRRIYISPQNQPLAHQLVAAWQVGAMGDIPKDEKEKLLAAIKSLKATLAIGAPH